MSQNASDPTAQQPPKEKTAKELEKERKKAEKLAKFNAKKQKQAEASTGGSKGKGKKEATSTSKDEAPVAEYIDETKPGEKKILADLDLPALKAYNPQIVESSWYSWWEKQGFFEPEFTKDGKIKPEGKFVVPAPPPNVTGALHIGHALTIAIQDSLVRFNRMRGKTVLFIPGFDHAGISTQSVVEKMLWKKEKKTRHDLGRKDFIDLVWEWKQEYHERIKNQLKRLGASYDWNREAFTMDEVRSRAVVEAFVQLHDDGTIYRANRLVNWCVHLNTALSNLEVENKEIPGRTLLSVPGYDNKVEFGVLTSFAYPVENSNEKVVVATTRPETIFGDTAVAVHPDDERYKHLHGKFVLHPFLDRRLPIITDAEAVDMEFGTGAVKITPAHDPNDYATGKRHNLQFINILNDDGTLNENCGQYQGRKRFDMRPIVIEELKKKGLFVEQKDNPMKVPLCEKSKDVIEPLMKPQWWVSQKPMADAGLDAVRSAKILIHPNTSRTEFFSWLSNIQDWCISRQLWWGHQCPVYFVNIDGKEDQKKEEGEWWVAGRNLDEAEKKAAKKFPNEKFTLEQDEDVLDTWFSSGLWPLSTLGWPKETKDLLDFYPMQLLETGWDILFFWVARMVMLALKLKGEVPFTEVFCHSLVRDAQGRKMSKTLGNVIDPLDVIGGISLDGLYKKLYAGNLDPREVKKAADGQKMSFPRGIPECGTDALRFALCAYTTGGRDINLDILRVEGYRKFCNKIYQATKFALMRLGDDYKPKPIELIKTGKESLVEVWILHQMNKTAQSVNKALDERDFLTATSDIYSYWLHSLCDVYIENSKPLILEGTPQQVESAKDTLYTALDGALTMIHPFMPYITEELWQRIPRRPGDETITITRAKYPQFKDELDDLKAQQQYDLVLEVVKNVRSLTSQYRILSEPKVYVQCNDIETGNILKEQESSITALIKGCDEIIFLNNKETRPSGTAVSTVNQQCNVLLMVKGRVDLDGEILKAKDKIEKAKSSKEILDNVALNPDYELKVAKHVRDGNVLKVEKLKAEIENLEEMILNFEQLKL